MDKKQGKLIVIDGIDGSGKTTQIELLTKYLASENMPFEVISFPQYGKNEYARQITDYLEGKKGSLQDVDPYKMAKLYASDRLTARELITGWLESGELVIANRYVSASIAHLGANMEEGEREKFMEWIDTLEYQTNNMPKPTLNILLKVDPKIGQQNALKDHLVDIHEQSLEHEQKASGIYLKISQLEENWMVLDCMEKGEMKSKEKIHQEIINILQGKIYPIGRF